MAPLVIEVLLGLYLGLLTGIVPALIAGGLGFVFKYFTGVTLPGLGVVVLAVAIAGVSGGLLGLVDPDITQSPRLLVALVVVMMLSLYAHDQGDRLGSQLPRHFSLRDLGTRTLSGEVIFKVGGLGRVEVTPFGDIQDLEGYPSLSEELRADIADGRWEFSSDLPIEAIERRLEERLIATYELTDVEVEIDDKGRARIAAAPPLGSLSGRVPPGHRAVSIAALVPTGVARRERVALHLPEQVIEGTVLSARSDPNDPGPVLPDGGDDAATVSTAAPRTTGGEGRVTVAVPGDEAVTLLKHDRARLVVLPRGLGLEYEAVRLLREAGNRFVRATVESIAGGRTVADLAGDTGVRILAVRRTPGGDDELTGRTWQIDPRGSQPLETGDELIAVGTPAATRELEGRLS
ncbi:MAG: TrkA C-terminal domain-containing protein [Halobacteriota archaeon]